MPDDLIPVAGSSEGGGGQSYDGDLGFPEEQPQTQSDVEPEGTLQPEDNSEGDTTEPEEGAQQGEDNQEPPAAAYKWRDKEYSTPEELIAGVDQHFKSWEGRMRVMQQTLQESEGLNKRWEAYFDYLEGQKEKANEPEPEPPKEPWEQVEWGDVETIAQKHGIANAVKFALMKSLPAIREEIKGQVSEIDRTIGDPVRAAEQERVVNEQAFNMFLSTATRVDQEGNSLFPEIDENSDAFDPQASKMIAGEWQRIRTLNPEFGNSPEGVATAYNNFRVWAMKTGYQSQQAQATEAEGREEATKTAERVRDKVTGRFVEKNKAKAESTSGGSSTPTPGTGGGKPQSMSEAAQRRRIRDAGRKNLTDRDRKAKSIFGVY